MTPETMTPTDPALVCCACKREIRGSYVTLHNPERPACCACYLGAPFTDDVPPSAAYDPPTETEDEDTDAVPADLAPEYAALWTTRHYYVVLWGKGTNRRWRAFGVALTAPEMQRALAASEAMDSRPAYAVPDCLLHMEGTGGHVWGESLPRNRGRLGYLFPALSVPRTVAQAVQS